MSSPRLFTFLAVLTISIAAWSEEPNAANAKPDKAVGKKIVVGPETEKRFPPLIVPDGFKATLFACDPLIEYPSVIAIGPRSGMLFVAHDYMTGLGVEIVRRDEIRLIEDTDGDGYADKSTVFAKGFNSIQGLAYDGESVFAMHAPFLTRVTDTDGDNVADKRKDLIKGLGLPPEENSNRLHCANGVVVGHDGWLYLALGDRGCDVKRPEGDRLLFQQGGILRCRRDGSDLHVFSTGLRNIYDIALDDELNVFVRDNENDGGDYMIRVCHCFHGSYHGYPYDYYEHPDEAMTPLADLGRGSSAGGTTYLETAFPNEFRSSHFYCEWGRAVVRYPSERKDSSFEPMKEIDFASGAPTDPYGFKPTDLVVDYDGSMLVSDWCDGQRPKRGRGRIYRISYQVENAEDEPADVEEKTTSSESPEEQTEVEQFITQLGSPSYLVRIAAQRELEKRGVEACDALFKAIEQKNVNTIGRMHAMWVLTHVRGAKALEELFRFARGDVSVRVRVQAIRAIADLTDPILARHRLDATQGDPKIAEKISKLRVERDPRVMLEVIIALGRLNWKNTPRWLFFKIKSDPDPAIVHAAMQAMRRSKNWEYVLTLVDNYFSPMRKIALRAVAEQYDKELVRGLLDRQMHELVGRVYKKPGPWEYWGFRPEKRPVNPVDWELTTEIRSKLSASLRRFAAHDAATPVLARLKRSGFPVALDTIMLAFRKTGSADEVRTLLDVLKEYPDRSVAAIRDRLRNVVLLEKLSDSDRIAAVGHLEESLDQPNHKFLVEVAKQLDDGPVLAAALSRFNIRWEAECDKFLIERLAAKSGDVRAAAIRSLGSRKYPGAVEHLAALLDDEIVEVRRAAAYAAGKLEVKKSATRLAELAADNDRETCRASLVSLRQLDQAGAVDAAVAALDYPVTQLAAVQYLGEQGDGRQLSAVKKVADVNRSIEIMSAAVRAVANWEEKSTDPSNRKELLKAVSKMHGDSGVLLRWTTFGPLAPDAAKSLIAELHSDKSLAEVEHATRKIQFATGTDSQVSFTSKSTKIEKPVWLAIAHLENKEQSGVEFLAASNGSFEVWLNSKSIYLRDQPSAYRPNEVRFETELPAGASQLLVSISEPKDSPRFHLRFRRKSSQAEHERLIKLALTGRGSVKRGGEVFQNAEKFQCIKCHRIGEKGGRIGPDLTGIGSRFSRIHLIESILQPSRTVAPSYHTLSVIVSDGRVLSGVKTAEDEKTMTLGDNQGKTHKVSKIDIEEIKSQPRSTMPDGLEKRMTDREFTDLLAYLLSLRK